jgi:hypothetical protein
MGLRCRRFWTGGVEGLRIFGVESSELEMPTIRRFAVSEPEMSSRTDGFGPRCLRSRRLEVSRILLGLRYQRSVGR